MITRKCKCCGNEFKVYPSKVKDGHGKFCSHHCAAKMQPTQGMPERFWSKVNRTDNDKECWEWMRGQDHFGYGTFRFGGIAAKAHRVSYELTNGKIPNGLLVCHRCDNPKCVNPNHLFLGTYHDNCQDCISKGRRPYTHGKHNPNAKLTERQVKKIRSLYKSGRYTLQRLGNIFSIALSQIHEIVTYKSWVE